MKWKLPQYSGKDYQVLSFCVAPFALGINSLMLGTHYFTDIATFLLATVIAMADFSIGFTLCSCIGVMLRRIFRWQEGLGSRILFMVLIFLVITVVFLLMLCSVYEHIPFFHFSIENNAFVWACIGTGLFVVFITFLLEGIARYEIWKIKMKENEQLSNATRQSRLQGLKSQVNPHFLFNSLNSLSGLIDEDEEKAERFLDEMSKVYRYMLRNEEDQLVTVESELRFVDSYYHLLKTRYGDSLRIDTNVGEKDREKWIPPLTLQAIIENAFTQNVMAKEQPLHICIEATDKAIVVRNNVQPKLLSSDRDIESGIDNLITRYQVLHQSQVSITDHEYERIIVLPVFEGKKGVLV